MESSKKIKLAVVAFLLIAGGLLVRFGAIAGSSLSTSGVNVSMPSAKTLQVFLNGESSKGVSLSDEDGEMSLGASTPAQTTYWTAGNFSGDLSVGGTVQTSSTVTIGGSLVNAYGSYGVFAASSTMSGAATTTACAIQNTSGRTRVILGLGYVYAPTSSVGVVTLTAGTSTTAFATSTTPLVSAALTKSSSKTVLSTTSTIMGTGAAYAPWDNSEYVTFKSSSTTNSGNCWILYN